MATKPLPSQRLLRRVLSYDEETGILFWRPRPLWMFCPNAPARRRAAHKKWHTCFAGKSASKGAGRGYKDVLLFGETFRAHRIIWKLAHGVDPECIDHINRERGDNRLSNLRNIRFCENQYNQSVRSDCKSGVPGVIWVAKRGEWMAQIGVGGKRTYLGYFKQFDDAVKARRLAEAGFTFQRV